MPQLASMSKSPRPTVDALVQQAFALHLAGRMAEAEAAWRAVLARSSKNADALHLLGVLLHQRQDFADALVLLDQAVAISPDFAVAWTNRGLTLAALDRLDEALRSYQTALKRDPNFAQAWTERARVLRRLGRRDEALISAERAITASGSSGDPTIRAIRAGALAELSRFDEALEEFNAVLAARPADTETLNGRAASFFGLSRYEEALADVDAALALQPDNADVLRNRASALWMIGRNEEALETVERTLADGRGASTMLGLKGCILHDLDRPDEALENFEAALQRNPDDPDTLWNSGLMHLSRGDFARGWARYESRFRKVDFGAIPTGSAAPRWDYTAPEGRRILLHAEQGLGDTIQFVRYAPLLAARGATVFLEVQAPLKALLASMPGVAGVFARGEALPEHDVQAALMSMPLAFGTLLDTVPDATPYLAAPPDRIAHWRERLASVPGTSVLGTFMPGRRIGLVWSGNPDLKRDKRRSIPASLLGPLFGAGVSLISLQPEIRESDRAAIAASPLLDLGAELGDFADTAGLIANLDLVVSVDTSVAHLAGALGMPVWVLLGIGPDWRWLRGREDSPWYPSARLFRQQELGDWMPILAEVAADLRVL